MCETDYSPTVQRRTKTENDGEEGIVRQGTTKNYFVNKDKYL